MSDDSDRILTQLGLRIVARRRELNLTQHDLAERCGMAQSNVARIERGEQNLTVRSICRLAAELGVRPEELFGGTEADMSG